MFGDVYFAKSNSIQFVKEASVTIFQYGELPLVFMVSFIVDTACCYWKLLHLPAGKWECELESGCVHSGGIWDVEGGTATVVISDQWKNQVWQFLVANLYTWACMKGVIVAYEA